MSVPEQNLGPSVESEKPCRVETELLHNGNHISSWRVFKIMSEFVNGFDLLRKYGLAASIFGSTRAKPDSEVYQEAYKLGRMLGERKYTIITGGSSGVMEAANKGAYDVGAQSVGLNIKLPFEQAMNPYLTDSETFDHFFTRKVCLTFASEVYVFFQGGFGTLDEFFEITTLIQTQKIENIPVILVGRDYWLPLLEVIRVELLEKRGTISPEDIHIYKLVDTAEEAAALIDELVTCRHRERGDNVLEKE